MEKKEIVIGRNPVLEYLNTLNSGSDIELYISASAHGKIISDITGVAKGKGVKIISQGKDFFKNFSSSSRNQGVVLMIPRKNRDNNTTAILGEIRDKQGVVVLLDQITDPHNAGSIIRSAEAMGCGAVILPKNNSVDITETVIKTSAGATAHIEIITISNVSQLLDELKEMGFWIIGTSDRGTFKFSDIRDVRPVCIIIGSEGKGMRRLTAEKCDYIVSIPLQGNVSSLNASVAAGIVIYEITGK